MNHLETTLTEFDKRFGYIKDFYGDKTGIEYAEVKAFITSRYVDLAREIEGMKSEGDSLVKDVRNDTLGQVLSIIRDNH